MAITSRRLRLLTGNQRIILPTGPRSAPAVVQDAETIQHAHCNRERTEYVPPPRRQTPLTQSEFDCIVNAVRTAAARNCETWRKLLRTLWHSDLQAAELRELTWDTSGEVFVETDHVPRIGFRGGRRTTGYRVKNRTADVTYINVSPQAWQNIDAPESERRGYVFDLPRRDGAQLTVDQLVKGVSAICAAAGVLATSKDICNGAVRSAEGCDAKAA